MEKRLPASTSGASTSGWIDGSPLDPSRRRFFMLAMSVAAAGGLLGCDPPASRDRRLPNASDELSGEPKVGINEPKVPPPPPPPRIVQRPMPPTVEPLVRVRIAAVRSPTRSVRIEGDGQRVLIGAADVGPFKSVQLPATVEATSGTWVVVEGAGSRSAGTFQFNANAIDVKPAPSSKGGSQGVRFSKDLTNCGSLPWGARLVARSDEGPGAVDVVCHVPMEAYIPGVLAKELYSSWSLDAFIAQAVAARSYAVCEIAQSVDSHFDVVAGEASQAWIGQTTHKNSLEAVRRTRGMVMLWENRVVPAYYSSTCGGRPASATDAIASGEFNAIVPLRASPTMVRDCCKSAPAWRWKMNLPLSETAKRIALWAQTERPAMARIDGLRSIDIATVNAAGRPVTFRLTDARNQVFEIPSERLRWAFNADVPGLPAVKSRVKSADFTARVSSSTVTLEGRGFGHGVGMCQYGAESMSKQGATWRDILAKYYPGTEVFATYASKA